MDQPEITIKTFTSLPAFLTQIAESNLQELVADPGYFYFHTPAWVQVVWERWERERGSRPLLLAAYRQEELLGWWPLVLSKRTLGYRLQNLGQELSDYALPFIKSSWQTQRAALTAAFLQAALSQARHFGFAQFSGFLFPPEPFQPHTANELRRWLEQELPGTWEIGPAVDNRTINLQAAPKEPEAFLAHQFSRRFQKNLKMDEKKLRQAGPLTFRLLADFAEFAPYKEHYLSWYRYQDRDEGRRRRRLTTWWEFFQQLPNNQLATSILALGSEPISLIVGFWRGGQFDYFSPVFNPQYQGLSPGKIHLLYLIWELLHRGCPRFNFLVGGEEYKQHWSKESYHCWRLRFYHRQSLLGLAYWLRQRWRQPRPSLQPEK